MKETDIALGTPIEIVTRRMFTRIICRLSAYLSQSDFTMSEVAALHRIGQSQGLSIQALSQELSLSVSATSRLVSRLVDRGLLLRKTGAEDARVKVVTCSKAGARLLDQMSTERLHAILEETATLPPSVSEQVLGAVAGVGKEK
ncbi:MAG: MarR family transcriptional regulator [Polyangiaceae bacterium]